MSKFKKLALPLAAAMAFGATQPAYAVGETHPHVLQPHGHSSEEIANAESIQIGDEVFTQQDRNEIQEDFKNVQKNATTNNGSGPETTTYGIGSWIRKGVVYVLKHQKDRLPRRVVPWADKIIAALDFAEAWEVGAITQALVSQGVPPDVAYDFAYWAVFIFAPI